MILLDLFKKKPPEPLPEPVPPNPPPWDVPLDQTTATPIVMDDSLFL